MPKLIKNFKENKLINSSNIYDGGRLLNNVLENYRRIISQMPTVDGEGESITLNGCINAEFLKFELGGNTSQEEGTSPESPQDIHVVKGHNVITISNSDGTEFQTFPLDLPEGMELCGIGNYADTFENVDWKWYKNKKINKILFGWGQWMHKTSANFWCKLSPTPRAYRAYMTSYRYASRTAGFDYLGNFEFGFETSGTFHIKNTNYTTEESITRSLIGEQMYYALQTPILEEITDPTLISQLEAIKRALSYAGTTIITQENEDLPFNLSVSALKDLHTLEYANYLNE